jgi:multidrug efflux system membrane fusion protein
VHTGDLVRANDTAPLVIINQVAPIYITFAVPGRFLPEIRQNQARQPLRIEAQTQPGNAPGAQQTAPTSPGGAPSGTPSQSGGAGQKTTGVVSFIDNTVDPTTGTIKLKGTFANADNALWPGSFVQVTLVLSTDANAVVVPSVAVQASQAGQYVFVVKPDRTVELRNVKVDRQQGAETVIAEGVRPGEEVVTDGHLRLTEGARVTTGGRGQGVGTAEGGEGGGGGARSGGGRGREGH